MPLTLNFNCFSITTYIKVTFWNRRGNLVFLHPYTWFCICFRVGEPQLPAVWTLHKQDVGILVYIVDQFHFKEATTNYFKIISLLQFFPKHYHVSVIMHFSILFSASNFTLSSHVFQIARQKEYINPTYVHPLASHLIILRFSFIPHKSGITTSALQFCVSTHC